MMKFPDSVPSGSGFYRNPESAQAEAATIKQNAANGPQPPLESAEVVKERIEKALRQ